MTFAPLFNITPFTFILTLCNTGIIVFAYWKFLHKPVCTMLEKRAEAVKTELDAATSAKKEAAAVKDEYTTLLANSKAEANKIISAATAKAHQREDEIVNEAKGAALQIRQKAEADIELERKRAVNEIKNQIAEIVVMAAGAVAEKEINAQDNAALIESFLVNAGE